MKIKQSFIDRCGEINTNQTMEISQISKQGLYNTIRVLEDPQAHSDYTDILKATANVLKINLSDIYEVEYLPHTL